MNLVWFRRDLRIQDHLALAKACASGQPTAAVFFETVEQWKSHHLAPIQADLIYRRLNVLKAQLAELNVPFIFRSLDEYKDIPSSIKQLCEQLQVTNVLCTRDYEVNELIRDDDVAYALRDTRSGFHVFDDKCIFPPGEILTKTGQIYRVFTPFKKNWLEKFRQFPQPPLAPIRPAAVNALTRALLAKKHPLEFRYTRTASIDWPVDDATIQQRLVEFCQTRVEDYDDKRDFPAESGTSLLSPYLAIGAISPRLCVDQLLKQFPDCVEGSKDGAGIWLSEIIWREFYQHIVAFYQNVSKGKGFQEWTDAVEWSNDHDKFERWKAGETGFPIVDAAMRQLNQTGWMHNRLRMVVASFLVKDLHIDWRWGEAYFMSRLIDGDFAANNGGWQWAASVGTDAQPYFRVFNPTAQSKKFDPQVLFIRKWLKELDEVPDKSVHEPHGWAEKNGHWLTYPLPIVDHKWARLVAIERFEKAKSLRNDGVGANVTKGNEC